VSQYEPHSDPHELPFPRSTPQDAEDARPKGSDAGAVPPRSPSLAADQTRVGARSKPGGVARLWRRAKWAGGLVAVMATGFVVLMAYYTLTLPHPFKAGAKNKTPVIRIVARDGTLLAERGRPHDYIPLQLLPKHVVGAVIATEDRRFHEHWGIDPYGMIRASLTNLRRGRVVQGGSTLTQQLAKNLFLTHERTLLRKVEEFALALWLELRLSKREILELYLNRVYLGSGAYGVEAAAQKYFGKSARALDIGEAAIIAGLLQAPSRYSPLRNPKLALARGKVVLSRMRAAGIINKSRERKALARAPRFQAEKGLDASEAVFGYAIDHVLDALPSLNNDTSGILIVETTIDARMQRQAQAQLKARLARTRKGAGAPQGAVVVLNPDGAIRALVGGRDYVKSQFNRAVKAKRQPGSAFKPFVYLAALADGYTPDTQVLDLPVSVNGWSPRNSNGRFSGAISLSDSLARSVNTVAVRLQQQTGAAAVTGMARKAGITSELRSDPTLALGTSEVTPLELTTAYAMLANGGLPVQPHIVARIRTHLGRVLFAHKPALGGRQIEGRLVGQINRMLRQVVNKGTGRRARFKRHDLAGKTGTTQDGRDAWFVGFSSHLTTGVWVGYDDGGGKQKLSGATLPAIIFKDVMASAHADLPVQPLVWTLESDVATQRGAPRGSAVSATRTTASRGPVIRATNDGLVREDWPKRKPLAPASNRVPVPPKAPVVERSPAKPIRPSLPKDFIARVLRTPPPASRPQDDEEAVVVQTTTLQGIRRDADRGPLNALIERLGKPETRTARTSRERSRMSLGGPDDATDTRAVNPGPAPANRDQPPRFQILNGR
jgi:penicillin-binding protein 1A